MPDIVYIDIKTFHLSGKVNEPNCHIFPAEIKDFCWHGMKLSELEWVLFILTTQKV